MSRNKRTMIWMALVCVASETWADFAPAAMPRMVRQVTPIHEMNVSMATQEVLLTAWRDYTVQIPKPNGSWTPEEWKESLKRCEKSSEESRKRILSSIPQDDVPTVEHYFELRKAEEDLNFEAFLVSCRAIAEKLNISRVDEIIKQFRDNLRTGCLKEMPFKILAASWRNCAALVRSEAPEEEKGRTDIFLRRVRLRELSEISRVLRERERQPKSAKSTLYTMWCIDEARKVGLSPSDAEAVTDLIDEYLVNDVRVDKSNYTPKQWSDYQRHRETQFFQLIETAIANDPEHADQIQEAFELIRIRHERLKIREKIMFLRRVRNTAATTQLSENTTRLLIKELKKFLIITHGHIGFGDEDEKRADQELTMSFGVIKMRLLDKIPREEQEKLAHFFFMLSRNLPDAQQNPLRVDLRPDEDREPFENYTVSLARKCQMWNDSLYSFWEAHITAKPTATLIRNLNQEDYFKRRMRLLKKWENVKNITILAADESQAGNLACFFRAIEKDFVEARRNALYSHIQTDEMSFVGNFRRMIRLQAQRANISDRDLGTMLEIVRNLKPNVALPDNEAPTLGQLMEAYNAAHNFRTSFREQCYTSIKDHERLNKFFELLDAPFHRKHLTAQNLEDNGFICDTPEESEHKIRGPSYQPIYVNIRPRPIHGVPLHRVPGRGPLHANAFHDSPPGAPIQKVHHHHHNPLHAHIGKNKHHPKHEVTTEADLMNSISE